jgi:hypothetical protein
MEELPDSSLILIDAFLQLLAAVLLPALIPIPSKCIALAKIKFDLI